MASDLFEKLWPAFVSEMTEQLDSAELLLAKHAVKSDAEINQLFRNFHTIKGSSAMIGFNHMEALAHKAEDILAAVRNDEYAFDEAVTDILLEAISGLKLQFTQANKDQQNPPAQSELIAQLEAFHQQQLGQESAKLPELATDSKLLDEISQSAKLAVPSLVLGLDKQAQADRIEPGIKQMAKLASRAGFHALAKQLMQYLAFLDADQPATLLSLTADIFDSLKLIAKQQQIDLSLEMTSRICQSKLNEQWQVELGSMQQSLQQLAQQSQQDWPAEQSLALIEQAKTLDNYCSLFGYQSLNASLRYIRQLNLEYIRGYIQLSSSILTQIIAIIELAQQYEDSEAFHATCSDSLDKLQQMTAQNNHASDAVNDCKTKILTLCQLHPDALNDLSIDSLNALLHELESGKNAFEIDLRFENESLGEKVLTACQNIGEMIHSRTVFHDFVNGVAQRTSFCILLLSAKPAEDIEKILSIIDRKQEVYELLKADSIEQTADDSAATTVEAEEEAFEQTSDDIALLASETEISASALKIDSKAIDQLIATVGEVSTTQNRQTHLFNTAELEQHISLLKQFTADHNNHQLSASVDFIAKGLQQLNTNNQSIQSSIKQLQSSILDLRVIPIAYVFDRFHKYVRSIGKKLGKNVSLEIEGEQVKIDKAMIDILAEPLAHMVRNGIDHGIEDSIERAQQNKPEQGKIQLIAEQFSDHVIIRIIDDGRGLDKPLIEEKSIALGLLSAAKSYSDEEIFSCIFEPGFSTTQTLTETSGRGVGMDVVKNQISSIGGSINITSTPGQGTSFALKLPISTAIQAVVLLQSEQQLLAMPERFVQEVMHINSDDIQSIQGQATTRFRNQILPLYDLQSLITGINTIKHRQHDYEVLILANENASAGLIVDATVGRAEVLVKQSHPLFQSYQGLSGAAVIGDGQVVAILDCAGLFKLAMDTKHDMAKNEQLIH